MDGNYIVEIRYWQDIEHNDFVHYRKELTQIDDVLDYFGQFYHNQVIDINDWQNVTEEFLNQILIKTFINHQVFDYSLIYCDETYQYILEDITKLQHPQDWIALYPNDEESEQILEIRLDTTGYLLTYKNNQPFYEKILKKHNLDNHTIEMLIIRFLQGDMSDWERVN